MKNKVSNLDQAKRIYTDRRTKPEVLNGPKEAVIGYSCIYAPLEIISALNAIPFRVSGSIEEYPTDADKYLPRKLCPYIRSILSLSLAGKYDFLDGMVMIHTCDAMERSSRIWESVVDFPYVHYMDLPTKTSERHQKAFRDGIEDFRRTIEAFLGKEIDNSSLKKSIEKHNRQRHLVREIYQMTKATPPRVSGVEINEIIGAVTSLPVEEGNALLTGCISELRSRNTPIEDRHPRILIWGSILDNSDLIGMIESAGANVVIDDTCTGTRGYWTDIDLNYDPFDALAHHYLVDLKCPRTFRQVSDNQIGKKSYRDDLEFRFGYLREFVDEWRVEGAILQSVRYCDCHGFEVPQVKDYFDSLGIPTFYLEHDYTKGGLEVLKMRVEAFLEMITQDLDVLY